MENFIEDLKSNLQYHPDGYFTWIGRTGPRVVIGSRAGCHNHEGYEEIKFRGKKYRTHKLVFLWHHGYMHQYVDHINRDPRDNRIENLRECTASENACNRNPPVGKSGLRNIRISTEGTFNVRIRKDGKTIDRTFKNLDDALEFRDTYKTKLHGQFAIQ